MLPEYQERPVELDQGHGTDSTTVTLVNLCNQAVKELNLGHKTARPSAPTALLDESCNPNMSEDDICTKMPMTS